MLENKIMYFVIVFDYLVNNHHTMYMKPKSFDPEKTLQVIAETFAKHGYEGTSLDLLIQATGLGKQSIYNTYGDKKAILEKAMTCAGKKSEAFQHLTNTDLTGRQRLEKFFMTTVAECTKKSPGCLTTNILLEKGACDDEIAKTATSIWNKTRLLFESVLADGVKDKSITSKHKPELLSYVLMNFLNGLRVTLRVTNDKENIQQMVKTTLSAVL